MQPHKASFPRKPAAGMSARPERQQPPTPESGDPDDGTLTEHAAAVDQANQDVAKEARRAKRRRATRKVVDASAGVAGVVAEAAVDVAADIISSLSP